MQIFHNLNGPSAEKSFDTLDHVCGAWWLCDKLGVLCPEDCNSNPIPAATYSYIGQVLHSQLPVALRFLVLTPTQYQCYSRERSE